MASTALAQAGAGTTNEATGALSNEKTTYRQYVKFGVDGDGKTTITERRILSETEKKVPEKDSKGNPNVNAGLSVNWAKAEEDRLTLLSENDFITYTVRSQEGFELLCPDEAIRLYIIQTGLSSIQTARANGAMKELQENTPEPTPAYNQATIDLRLGVGENSEYSINKTPSKRSVSEEDKLRKLLTAMGVTGVQQDATVATIMAAKAAAGQLADEPETQEVEQA